MGREKQTQSTAQHIRHAMIELLSFREYSDLSAADISRAARVSRSTFYTYFHGEKDLAQSTLEYLEDQFLRMTLLPMASSANSYERVDKMAAHFFRENGRALRQLIELPTAKRMLKDHIEKLLEQQVAAMPKSTQEERMLVSAVLSATFEEALENPDLAQHFASGIVDGLIHALLAIVPHSNQGATLSARSFAYHFFGRHL